MSKELARLQQEMAEIEQTIAAQQQLGEVIPPKQQELILAAFYKQRDDLQAQIATLTLTLASGTRSVAFGGDVEKTVVITGDGAQVVIGELPIETPQIDPGSALEHYLRYIISRNRYLQHQGIRSGGKLVQVELERIYIRLRASRQRTITQEEEWLEGGAQLAPGELPGRRWQELPPHSESVTVSVEEALAEHHRLVVLGDPGSGKTTLLRYLALIYARDLAVHESDTNARIGVLGTLTGCRYSPPRMMAQCSDWAAMTSGNHCTVANPAPWRGGFVAFVDSNKAGQRHSCIRARFVDGHDTDRTAGHSRKAKFV